jgi:hypothetical protein
VAANPSPEKPSEPFPAIVKMLPEERVRTFRIRLLFVSAMNRLPLESMDNPYGLLILAESACPPSPSDPVPFPTNSVICPLNESTRRTWLIIPSEMYTLPAESTARPWSIVNVADVAGPPSPDVPTLPVPAIEEIIPPFDRPVDEGVVEAVFVALLVEVPVGEDVVEGV